MTDDVFATVTLVVTAFLFVLFLMLVFARFLVDRPSKEERDAVDIGFSDGFHGRVPQKFASNSINLAYIFAYSDGEKLRHLREDREKLKGQISG